MGRILTLRGVVPEQRRERVLFFDSNIQNRGWKIKDVKCMNTTIGRSDIDTVLHTTDRVIGALDWDRNTVIACMKYLGSTGIDQSLVDYGHVIVGNLYLTNLDSAYDVAYLITLEEVDLTSSQNIMYQLKEVAQNSANN